MTILGPDLRLDDLTHDLMIVDGAPQIVADVAQAIKIRLSTVRGEWFLDTELGIPYFEDLFVKAPDLGRVRSIYRQEIIDTPGVLDVRTIDLDYAPATRELTISFNADSDAGEIDDTVEIQL